MREPSKEQEKVLLSQEGDGDKAGARESSSGPWRRSMLQVHTMSQNTAKDSLRKKKRETNCCGPLDVEEKRTVFTHG